MVQLGREVGEEKGERGEMRDERERGNNKGGQFKNVKCLKMVLSIIIGFLFIKCVFIFLFYFEE